MRNASITRTTKETDIAVFLDLDQGGEIQIDTGIGFFNHMLELFAFHGGFSLRLKAEGDLHVCDHHTIEDCGIVLGECLKQALGDHRGIARYGNAAVPMDEALAQVSVDISNRPYLICHWTCKRERIGDFSCEMLKEFLRAFADHAEITLHVNVWYGENDHHKIEAICKALGRACKAALTITHDTIPSSKGIL